MKFLPRAAAFAAVTFCAGALANRSHARREHGRARRLRFRQINAQEHHVVPAPAIAAQPVLTQRRRDRSAAPRGGTQGRSRISPASPPRSPRRRRRRRSMRELNCLAGRGLLRSEGRAAGGPARGCRRDHQPHQVGALPARRSARWSPSAASSRSCAAARSRRPPANAQCRKALAVAQGRAEGSVGQPGRRTRSISTRAMSRRAGRARASPRSAINLLPLISAWMPARGFPAFAECSNSRGCYASPAVSPSDAPAGARAMSRAASRRMLLRHDCVAMAEVPLDGGRRADLMAIDARGNIVIVEIKVSRADLLGDAQMDRLSRALRPLLLGGAGGVRPAAVRAARRSCPQRAGLIVADRYDAAIVREAATRAARQRRRARNARWPSPGARRGA